MDGVWTDGFDGPRDGEFGEFHQVLTPGIIPQPDAPFWMDIAEFALTFDGYEALAADRLGDLASESQDRWLRTGVLPKSLVELRSCLFFEQRRWRQLDATPEGHDLAYIRTLIEAIRIYASTGEPAPSEG